MSPTGHPPGDDGGDGARYEELRRLLLGPELRRLEELSDRSDELARRLDDDTVRAEEVAAVLPDAILQGSRDDRLGAALAPSVEESLQVSIRRNPKALVEAISPIMGPAIRRSILQAIGGMVQTFNEAMEQSFSPRGLRWRIEAWRTGRSFGEVVALHTLLYRVEQVFLIHKETGLLLHHRSVRKATDPDLVGSMLVAIRDFVSDSFEEGSPDGGTLDTVRVGDRTVWVEGGRDAVLAAVVQGRAPESLRDTMTETLEQIELAYGESLRSFDGDAGEFAETEALLAECMVSQAREGGEASRRERSAMVPAFWAVASLAVVVWAGLTVRDRVRWSRAVEALDAQAGIVVTGWARDGGQRVVSGLRDRWAVDPADILVGASVDTSAVVLALEPYESLDHDIVLRRAAAALRPPDGSSLRLEGDRLLVAGTPPTAWLTWARDRAPFLSGVSGLHLEGDVAEAAALAAVEDVLQEIVFRFQPGAATIQEHALLDALRSALARADSLAMALGSRVPVTVVGSADTDTGSPEFNRSLALRRAEAVLEALPGTAYPSLDFDVETRLVAADSAGDGGSRTVIFRLDASAR